MKRHFVGKRLFACCLCLMSVAAKADIADILRDYDHGTRAEQALAKAILRATEAGFSAANTELKDERRETPLYCAPERLNLTGEQLIDILRRWVDAKRAQTPRIDTAPMPMGLLYALEDAFPCAK